MLPSTRMPRVNGPDKVDPNVKFAPRLPVAGKDVKVNT